MTPGGGLQVGVGLSGSIARFLADLGLPAAAAGLLGQVVAFLVAFAAVYLVGRNVVIPIVNRMLIARDLEPHARRPIRRLVAVVVAFVAITAAFGAAGYPDFLRSLATIAAAATLAIGFAMQDVLKNFVSGIFIYTDKPFKIGDWIQWDGNSGIVEEARDDEQILSDPAPSVRLTELGDSSVTLTSRIWIDDPSRADFVRTRAEYVQTVKRRFDDEGIDIPYPNRTLGGELTVSGLGEVDPVEE